jgi:pimeloyl-ACP methyl ester carboxylesterase
VAIRLAMRHPGRFSTVTAFEPVMFQALLQARPDDEAALQPVRIAGRMHAQICAGRPAEAARLFYDYWSGEGAWSGLEPEVQRTIAARMPAIYACFQSLFADRTSREELARMRVPTLLLSGDHSPASGRAATRLMAEILPKAWWKALPGMGHMGPVEQPERVNAEIARFLKASQRAPVAYRPFDTGNFQGWGAAVPA